MKNILLAVDDTKSSIASCEKLADLLCCCLPEKLVLLYVEKIEGASVMDDLLLSDSEINTLKEALKGTEYQELLDKKAGKIIDYFSELLTKKGITAIRPVVRQGHPAEEIMAVAKEENVDAIAMGTRGSRVQSIVMGSVSREVADKAELPVLLLR